MLSLNQLKQLYLQAPPWLQNLYASIPYTVRNGPSYLRWHRFLQKEIDEDAYTLLKMKETLLYAYTYVPYYRGLFDTLQASPHDFNTPKDLTHFPLLTKALIRENFNQLQSTSLSKRKRFFVRTGGTTGTPATFYQSVNVWKKELAFVNHFFGHYGYTPKDLKVSFKGGHFEEQSDESYMHYNPVSRTLILSPLHLNRKSIYRYVEILNTYKIRYFHTYPSTLLLLIRQMMDNGLTLDYRPKAVFLTSEGYDPEDIHLIQTIFQCPVTSFYGHSERILFAGAVDGNDLMLYQHNKRYGLFELLDDKQRSITVPNREGNIVGTSFDNFAMPLIRYLTDDTTHYVDQQRDTIAKIESLRNKLYLDAKKGVKISITFLSISSLSKHILAFQFFQSHPGHLELRIVPSKAFEKREQSFIERTIKEKIGDMMDIEVSLVTELSRTERGKARSLIKAYDSGI